MLINCMPCDFWLGCWKLLSSQELILFLVSSSLKILCTFRACTNNPFQGSWYSGPELFKRAGTWFICNPLGSMVSGYLQSAAYTNLSGVGGMPGWRWLFIIDGIFTIPVAVIGFIIFPGIPDSPRPFYLTEKDIEMAKERGRKAGIRRPGKLNLDVFKRSLKRWHIWVFITCYA
jgi:MFS transporter, ACS family, pantothenate transporter